MVRVGWDRGYGRVVEIAHGFGIRTLFAHLETPRVAEGQRVRRGDLVGLVGSTGRSTGPHLHWGMSWFDVRIDPQLVLERGD